MAGRGNLSNQFKISDKHLPECDFVKKLGLSVEETKQLSGHVFSYSRNAAYTKNSDYENSWVVISTPNSIHPDLNDIDKNSFSEVFIDEADFGIIDKSAYGR